MTLHKQFLYATSCIHFLITFFVTTLYAGNANFFIYPTPLFSKLEKTCNELINDFDALRCNNDLYKEWIENSDYLLNQLVLLVSTVSSLVDNHEECKAYLLEDTHYLINLLSMVENHYSMAFCPHGEVNEAFTYLLQDSKYKLESLLSLNQEYPVC